MVNYVRYTGETKSFEGDFINPNILVKGKIYELISFQVHNWHTTYNLKGVKGDFNSVWFDEVKPIYSGFIKQKPEKVKDL